MSKPIEWTTTREIEVTHTLRVATRDYATMVSDDPDYATMVSDDPATPDDLRRACEVVGLRVGTAQEVESADARATELATHWKEWRELLKCGENETITSAIQRLTDALALGALTAPVDGEPTLEALEDTSRSNANGQPSGGYPASRR